MIINVLYYEIMLSTTRIIFIDIYFFNDSSLMFKHIIAIRIKVKMYLTHYKIIKILNYLNDFTAHLDNFW